MKKILWLSRHELEKSAIESLKVIFGDQLMIYNNNIVFSNNGDEALKQLLDISTNYDIVGGVFPSQLWISILNHKDKINKSLFVVVSVPSKADANETRQFIYDHIEVYKSN